MAKQTHKPKTAPTQTPPAPPEQENEGHARTVRVVSVLRVSAKRDGFRRAGHAFYAEPRDIAINDLTEAQIEQIKADPMLTCVEVDADVTAE